MLLAIDVGNSNNVIGLFSGDKLLTHWRIRTEWTRTSDEYWVLIKEFILLNNVEAEIIDDIITTYSKSNSIVDTSKPRIRSQYSDYTSYLKYKNSDKFISVVNTMSCKSSFNTFAVE